MRWSHSRARERIRTQQGEADRVASLSKENIRRVEARQPQVDRVVGLLKFYSDRNGFADAFEEMLGSREGGRGHEARG